MFSDMFTRDMDVRCWGTRVWTIFIRGFGKGGEGGWDCWG